MYSLLGDVDGKRVLDAGCGPGHYTEWLIAHGATVLAIDSSPRMVQLARQRGVERDPEGYYTVCGMCESLRERMAASDLRS